MIFGFVVKQLPAFWDMKIPRKRFSNMLMKKINVHLRGSNPGGANRPPLTWNAGNTIYINESGLYSLILRSKIDKAKDFQRWVTKEVLPSIRKTGKYEFNNRPYKMLTFNINTEYDLQKKTVNFIRNNYPKAILIPTLR